MMKIWTSSYQLYPIGSLQTQNRSRFRKGTLLRIEFENGQVGYSDLCPYPEFGDQPLEMEIQNIVRNQPSRLAKRSTMFARLDADARAKNEPLYNNARIKNHFFVADLLNFDLKRIPLLQAQRFTHFKMKLGRELILETEMVKSIVEKLSTDAKIRLDFNAHLSRERFNDWIEKNLKWLKPHLDFIEDPFAYEAKDWARVQTNFEIDLALDLAGDPLRTMGEGANVVIIKPAIQDELEILKTLKRPDMRFVMTHYMDFPVGQMSAYAAAQRAVLSGETRLSTCGLQHHDVYEGFTFQDAIGEEGPYIVPPQGAGLGFTDLLEKQEWNQIK